MTLQSDFNFTNLGEKLQKNPSIQSIRMGERRRRSRRRRRKRRRRTRRSRRRKRSRGADVRESEGSYWLPCGTTERHVAGCRPRLAVTRGPVKPLEGTSEWHRVSIPSEGFQPNAAPNRDGQTHLLEPNIQRTQRTKTESEVLNQKKKNHSESQ